MCISGTPEAWLSLSVSNTHIAVIIRKKCAFLFVGRFQLLEQLVLQSRFSFCTLLTTQREIGQAVAVGDWDNFRCRRCTDTP